MKHAGGRPKGAKMDHPDRFALAQFEAQIAIGKDRGLKERPVIRNLVALAIGEPIPTPDNLDRMLRKLPFRVWTPPLKLPKDQLNRVRVDDERFRDAFTPYVEDLHRQLRVLRTKDDSRGAWHRIMAKVFRIFIEGDAAKLDQARRLAASVGEGAFFERELAPRMIADPAWIKNTL